MLSTLSAWNAKRFIGNSFAKDYSTHSWRLSNRFQNNWLSLSLGILRIKILSTIICLLLALRNFLPRFLILIACRVHSATSLFFIFRSNAPTAIIPRNIRFGPSNEPYANATYSVYQILIFNMKNKWYCGTWSSLQPIPICCRYLCPTTWYFRISTRFTLRIFSNFFFC